MPSEGPPVQDPARILVTGQEVITPGSKSWTNTATESRHRPAGCRTRPHNRSSPMKLYEKSVTVTPEPGQHMNLRAPGEGGDPPAYRSEGDLSEGPWRAGRPLRLAKKPPSERVAVIGKA